MKKKIGKIVLIIIIGVVILFLVSKVYHFIIINKVYHAIEDFKYLENRYYAVTVKNPNIKIKDEIIMRGNIVKCKKQIDNVDVFCEWIDFYENLRYFISLKSRNFKEDDLITMSPYFLGNIPSLINDIYKDDKLNLEKLLKIKYIIPTKYDETKCYKIVTNLETLIVDKETYLPVYSSLKFTNSNYTSQGMTENIYEFRVGGVTEEEIALPDLTGYQNNSEKE